MAIENAKQDVKEYYKQVQVLYNLFYSKGTNGLHYGLWSESTKKAADAILNTNKFVLKHLEINSKDSVLDAGCGVGGTSIFIAENSKASVAGITISEVQVQQAKKNALKSKNSELLSFSKQDYTKTNFKDKAFSKIIGIESVSHAHKKIDFLKEAYRILDKNGKIIVVDGYLERQNLNEKEKEIYLKWLHGWGISNLSTVDSFRKDLKKAGFVKIKYCNMFDKIKKSRDRIFKLGLFGFVPSWVFLKLGIISKKMHNNTMSCIYQKKIFSDFNNIATYGVFIAEK